MNHMINTLAHLRRRREARVAITGLLLTGSLLLAACGEDEVDAAPSATEAPAATDAPSADAPPSIEVTTVDFGYGSLPTNVPAGTAFTLVNESESELHELVAVRLPDTETRSVAEMARDDIEALFAGPPAMVLLAAPGSSETIVAVGDGTLSEPGRYAIVCMIPTGVDPQVYLEAAAASQGGPPQVEGGAPHIAHGMFAEVVVD